MPARATLTSPTRLATAHPSSPRIFRDRIPPFDTTAAIEAAQIAALAEADGASIEPADGQIAAIARIHGFAVAARDTAPFQRAGLTVINPWETT
jgi:predicted nucleic acid-binding protein